MAQGEGESNYYNSVVLNRYVDSTSPSVSDPLNNYKVQDPYAFRVKQLILPATLILVGSTSQYINAVDQLDKSIYTNFQEGKQSYHFDDYLQYAPYATMWILDACGVESRHRFREQTTNLAVSMAFMGILVNVGKYTIQRQRPNDGSFNSMPSGHTAMAFTGAEILRQEFGHISAWIGVAGYAVAGTVGFMRLWNNRHYLTDVLVGAGIGVLSVRAAYWLAPTINRLIWGSDLRGESKRIDATITPYSDGESSGMAMMMSF